MQPIKKFFFVLLIVVIAASSACKKTITPPSPYGPIPSKAQQNWQKMEYYMFIHFGPNTFTDVEWGDGNEDPSIFNPTDLDCRQWASIAKSAGMKGIVITAKHHDGFCLWPSKYSTHTVRESPWKDGKGDVLKELSEACSEYNLKFGVYLSPWDQNHPSYGTPEYNQIFANTLEEVLTNYGSVFEQWFDGANGEGSEGKKQVYDWNLFHQTVYRHQPQAIIFSDIGPGCRWVGNEEGHVGETNWSRLNISGFGPGIDAPPSDTLNKGNIYGENWVPAEVNTSIRPGWFFSPSSNDKVKSVEQLVNIYYTSVGRNGNLLLNVPPDRRGRIHPNDSTRLMEFKRVLDQSFHQNLSAGNIVASTVRGKLDQYSPQNLLDGNYDTYWTTDDKVKTASIELDLTGIQKFNRILLQEYIPLGQRVVAFNVEYWNQNRQEWSVITEASTIGYKRILCFPSIETSKIRINIKESLACPVINTLEIYNAPDFSSEQGNKEKVHEGLSVEKWTVISPVQEDIKQIIDGNLDTYLTIPKNQAVVIDLGEETIIKGFFYIPLKIVGEANILRYNFYVGQDNKTWRLLKSNALFHNVRNNPIRQDVGFENTTKVRFIKLQTVETVDNNENFQIVELGIIK